MLSREEMKERMLDALPAWTQRVITALPEDYGDRDADEPPMDQAVTAALAEQEKYRLTPEHGEELNESEVQRCLAVGVRYIARAYYAILSPIDRPGAMVGPMPVGELLMSAAGHIEVQRGFSGMAPEPRPPRPQVPDPGGPYPWSWGGGAWRR